MFAQTNSETECKVCEDANARYRDKEIVAIDGVTQNGDSMRFYVEGGDGVYTLTWGNLSHHCCSGVSLPFSGQSQLNTFLRESYMNGANPPISFLADQKHPLTLPEAEYVPVRAEVRRVDLHFFYAGRAGQVPQVSVLAVDDQNFKQTPELRFGFTENLVLSTDAAKQLNPNDLRRACIVDVKLTFALPGKEEQQASLFDSTKFGRKQGLIAGAPGQQVDLTLNRNYYRTLSR